MIWPPGDGTGHFGSILPISPTGGFRSASGSLLNSSRPLMKLLTLALLSILPLAVMTYSPPLAPAKPAPSGACLRTCRKNSPSASCRWNIGRISTATGTKLSLTSFSSFSPRKNPARDPQLDPQVHPSGWPSPTQSRIGLPSAAAFFRACHRLVSHGISSKPPGLGRIRAWRFGNDAADRLSLTSALARTFAGCAGFSPGVSPARYSAEMLSAPAASITASTAAMAFRLIGIMVFIAPSGRAATEAGTSSDDHRQTCRAAKRDRMVGCSNEAGIAARNILRAQGQASAAAEPVDLTRPPAREGT